MPLFIGMYAKHDTGSETHATAGELPAHQSAVVLVGEAARDHRNIDALLSVNVVIILVPSLQSAHSLFPPGEERPQASAPASTTVGNLRIDLTEHRVLWGRRELRLSERELAMLATLSEQPGRACTFAELAEPEGGKWLGDTEGVHSAIKRVTPSRRILRGVGQAWTLPL